MTLSPSAPSPRETRLSLAFCFGIAAVSCGAHLGIIYTPFLVGGLIDRYGFGPALMGIFSTAETGAFALAMFVLAPRAHALRPRRLAIGASALIAIVQAASALTGFYPLLVAGRLATGFGYGMLNTAVNVAAARSGAPARAISVGISLQVLVFVVLNITVPMIGAAGGVAAEFVALAAVSALLATLMPLLPDAAGERGDSTGSAPPMPPGGWPVLAAMALFAFGTMAIWPFMERAAHAIGLSATRFGRYQAIAMFLSSVGNFTLTALLARGPRRGLLEASLLVCGATCALLTMVSSEAVFAVALQFYNVSWYVVYPLLLGLAYRHDPHGRLAVRTTGTWLVAQSGGALAAGFVAQATSGYALVGGLGLGTCVVAVMIVAWFQARLRPAMPHAPLPAH